MIQKTIPKIAPDHWLLGSSKRYMEDSIGFLNECLEVNDDIFEIRLGNKKFIILNKPGYAKHVLQKNQRNYKRHFAYEILQLLFGEGIITLEGEKWKEKRRLIQPFFNKKSVESYFTKINEETRDFIKNWPNTESIYLLDQMTRLSIDIINLCVLGVNIKGRSNIVQDNLKGAMSYLLEKMVSPLILPLWVPTKKNKKFKTAVNNLDKLIRDLIKEKEQNNFIDNDFITMYLLFKKDGEDIKAKEIFEQVTSLLFSGHETTANTLFNLICNVLQNKEVKEKIRYEYEVVTGGNPLQLEHLNQLHYVNNVIKEANRLSTPAWSIGREAIEDDSIDGYKIKKGVSVLISPYLLHRKEAFWKDPMTFNPDRFNEYEPNDYTFLTFGAGPKKCMGKGFAELEMHIVLYHILKSGYELADNTPPIEEMSYNTKSLMLRPDNDVKLVFSKKPSKISNLLKKTKEPETHNTNNLEGKCPFSQ